MVCKLQGLIMTHEHTRSEDVHEHVSLDTSLYSYALMLKQATLAAMKTVT